MGEIKSSRYYFNQFWAFKNPEILTYEDLREMLFERWDILWDQFPDGVEGKARSVGKKFEKNIRFGQCNPLPDSEALDGK